MTEYTLIRSKRKTISIEISPTGDVVVRAPKWCSKAEIEAFVQEKSGWIEQHQAKIKSKQDALVARGIDIKPLSEGEIKLLTKKARAEFKDLVLFWEPEVLANRPSLMQGRRRRISIRHQSTRWGSCSPKGNLNLNCLLMLAPPDVRNYIVVHELCHLIHMNHSQAFWAEVERVLPNYRTPKRWLKENGGLILARLP